MLDVTASQLAIPYGMVQWGRLTAAPPVMSREAGLIEIFEHCLWLEGLSFIGFDGGLCLSSGDYS